MSTVHPILTILHKFTLCCCNSGITMHIHPSTPTLFDNTLQHVNIGLTPVVKKKKKKHKKHKKALTVVKTFPFGIDQQLVDSFNNFFTECCLSNSNGPALLVGDVQKEYRKWCTDNKRAYCPERTSARWNVAPFVVNGIKKDKCPPFRLLMFGKLGRLPTTSEGVFSTTNTKWRRHKKNSPGWPIYKGLAWKDDFIPSVKYIQPSNKSKRV